jgi:hypothetical protein
MCCVGWFVICLLTSLVVMLIEFVAVCSNLFVKYDCLLNVFLNKFDAFCLCCKLFMVSELLLLIEIL